MAEMLNKLLGDVVPSEEDLKMLKDSKPETLAPPSVLVIDRVCHEIEARGLENDGLFRIPGGTFASRAVFVSLNHLRTGHEVNFKAELNVHNIGAALKSYLLNSEPLIPYSVYDALFVCIDSGVPVEDAIALKIALEKKLPRTKEKCLHRILKMLSETAKLSETNQMTSKNLAIVFSPVLFHDDAEPAMELAKNQGKKMVLLHTLISHFDVAYPEPFEHVYKAPARPGEVRTFLEKDWNLMLAKAEIVRLVAGQVLLNKGELNHCLYRVKKGQMEFIHGSIKVNLIAGDHFGETTFLGRTRSKGQYRAKDEVELLALSEKQAELIWQVKPQLACSFWGHIALDLAMEMRSYKYPELNESSVAADRLDKSQLDREMQLKMSGGVSLRDVRADPVVGFGGRLSTVFHEEPLLNRQLSRDSNSLVSMSNVSLPSLEGGLEDGLDCILNKECCLGHKTGNIYVSALHVKFEGKGMFFGTQKSTCIPFEAMDRISTSVADEVIRGKKLALKVYDKKNKSGVPGHTISITCRKRDMKSLKQVQKVFRFFTEADAKEAYVVIGKLFKTVAEERVLETSKRRGGDEDEKEGLNNAIVAKGIALFDYSAADGQFSFNKGDVLLLTTEKQDLRVKGRLDRPDAVFGLFPRDYVESIVWVTNVKGVPTPADLEPILSVGVRREFPEDAVVVKEGKMLDCVYFVEKGICSVSVKKNALGKVSKKQKQATSFVTFINHFSKIASGDFFGEVGFLIGGVASSATITAYTNVVCVEIKKEVLRSIFAIRVDLACKFYRYFAAVLLRRVERNKMLPYQKKKPSYMTTNKRQSSRSLIESMDVATKNNNVPGVRKSSKVYGNHVAIDRIESLKEEETEN